MGDNNSTYEYSRTKERLALLGTASSIVGGVLVVGSGLAAMLGRRLLPEPRPGLVKRLRYQATLSTGAWLAGLPLAFYSGYVVEKRFNLSRQSPRDWAVDAVKGEALSLPIQLGMVEGMQWAIRRWPDRWWLVVSGAAIPLTSLMVFLFPVLIAPRFNKYEPLRDRELAQRLQRMTERSGIQVADVLQVDMSRRTSKSNAFFTGIGSTRRIVVSDTMLDSFTEDEIETVVAHETGHQVYRDLWRSIAGSAGLMLAIAAATNTFGNRFIQARPELAGAESLGHPRALPVIAVAFAISGTLLTPLQLAYSRSIERRTDRFAVELSGNGAAYASALEKLAKANMANPNPPRWVTLLLYSHPPLGERIDAARSAAVTALWTG